MFRKLAFLCLVLGLCLTPMVRATNVIWAGRNLAAVKKLTIGVGDRANPTADGGGILYIDDIGFGRPAQAK